MKTKDEKSFQTVKNSALYFIRGVLISGLFVIPIGRLVFEVSGNIGITIFVSGIVATLISSTKTFEMSLKKQ